MCGAVVGGIQCQLLGRKKSLLVDSIALSAAYIGIGVSPNYATMMMSRFVCGHCIASLLVNVPSYTSEICQPEVRKITGGFCVAAFTSGFTLMLAIGALVQWRIAMYIMAAFPAASVILIVWLVPESPIWLLIQNRKADAREALLILRGNEVVADLELTSMSDNLEVQNKLEMIEDVEEGPALRWYSGFVEVYLTLKESTFLRPFGVLVVLFCIGLEWTGLPAIAFYMVNLLEEANIPINPYWGAAALAACRAILLVVSPVVTKNIRRRPMYLFGCVMAMLGNCGIGTYFLLKNKTNLIMEYPSLKWVPIVSILVIYSAFSFGFGSVPYMLQGEILPAQSRSLGSGMLGLLDNIFCFLATKTALTISELIGTHGAFYLYAACTLFSGMVAYFQMPETLGLSLEQIESIYKKEKKEKKNLSIPKRVSRSNSVMSFYEPVSQYGR